MSVEDIRKDDLDYSKELELDVQCDENDCHVAVSYCMKCETSLCKECSDRIHSLKSLSSHQVVRLTEKPEPPIKCCVHPLKKAKLICKQASCDGMNNPMCTMCHQYGNHKGHKYEVLDDEYDKVRENVASCLKEIEEKRAICDKNLEEYDNCILSYSNIDGGFVKSELNRIMKFYNDAKRSAVKKFSEFTEGRIDGLDKLKKQYTNEKIKLDNMSLEVRKIEEMGKMEMIQNGDNLKELMRQAKTKLNKPTGAVPCQLYNIKYPNAEAFNIEIDLPEHIRLQKKLKTLAVFFINLDFSYKEKPKNLQSFEAKTYGNTCKYKDGRTIIDLYEYPRVGTIKSSLYDYILVINCLPGYEKYDRRRLETAIGDNWWIKIIVLVPSLHFEYIYQNVVEVGKLSKIDDRVKVFKVDGVHDLVDLLF